MKLRWLLCLFNRHDWTTTSVEDVYVCFRCEIYRSREYK